MKKIDNYANIIVCTILVISAFCFWALRFPALLAYQEQMQMFLFDGEYFMERVVVPGGISRYIAEFFVQMYNNVYLGALVLSILYGVMYMLCWTLIKNVENKKLLALLSAIPVLLVWGCMGDVNTKLTFLIALLWAIVFMYFYPSEASNVVKLCFLLIATPILYWIAGPVLFVLILYVVIIERGNYMLSIGTVVYSVACVLLCSLIAPYPLYRLFLGIGNYHAINELPILQVVCMLVVSMFPLCAYMLSNGMVSRKINGLVFYASLFVIIIISQLCTQLKINAAEYDVLKYDYLVRTQRWDKIIESAEEKNPDSPLTVASLNLALGMKNQLNRSSQFFQNGVQGAFPQFNMSTQTSVMTMEIYYYLGLVNTAQRLAFEAMEAIPDNNKSSRLFRRLAETNLINGQYEVARKYLLILQKTMFYSKWANTTLSMLGDEDAINAHPVYGYLRNVHLQEDFLFSDAEIDKILGQLLMQNKDNVMAMQYLLLLPQLEGDQQKYQMYQNYVMSLRNRVKEEPVDSLNDSIN